MCVIAVAWQVHPEWPLAVIANRDELHDRSAQPLARWSARTEIIAGRDLEKGGTWLGVSEEGRFAALVNVAGGRAGNRPSRGVLVLDALSGEVRPLDELGGFSPFNLLCVTPSAFTVTTNWSEPETRSLSAGIHAISNAQLDAGSPRATLAKKALLLWLARPKGNTDSLLDMLGPQRADQCTGNDPPAHPRLFIKDPVYGTRCSTAVLVDRSGRGDIHERSFDAKGDLTGEIRLQFRWP